MDFELHEQGMPESGLYRAGRWTDVASFPQPAEAISPRLFSAGPPLVDGYPRWEDAYGRFSTAKFSVSAKSAIGRTLAGYRRFERDDTGILNILKGFFTSEFDNPNEPELVEGTIPRDYFKNTRLLHLEYDENVSFIDVEDQRTRHTLEDFLAGPLQALGVANGDGLSQHRDRRVTRIVMSMLHDICRHDRNRQHIAGIRYRAPEPDWEAFVLWSPPPPSIDLSAATVDPIFPMDPNLVDAAKSLGLSIP